MSSRTFQSELNPVEILLVDDDPADVELTTGALNDGKLLNRVTTVGDGVEALAYLRREGTFSGAVRPDLVLLDLNMPRKGGREVLAQIKADADLQAIPVVILTTSESDYELVRKYAGVSYITKPVDIRGFHKVVQSINEFWYSVVKMPVR